MVALRMQRLISSMVSSSPSRYLVHEAPRPAQQLLPAVFRDIRSASVYHVFRNILYSDIFTDVVVVDVRFHLYQIDDPFEEVSPRR